MGTVVLAVLVQAGAGGGERWGLPEGVRVVEARQSWFLLVWPKSRVAVTRGNSRSASSPPHSVIPEITKPLGGQFCVAHRVLNMAMPEILLDGAGIDAFVREVKATSMAQHMWMDRKGELSVKASAQNDMADGAIAEGAAPF